MHVSISIRLLGNRAEVIADYEQDGQPCQLREEGATGAVALSRLMRRAVAAGLKGATYEAPYGLQGTIAPPAARPRPRKPVPPDPLSEWGPYHG